MKRIVICMDGTWQTLSQENLTNIGLIARSVAHKETIRDANGAEGYIHQTVIYTQGVGANVSALAQRSFFAGIIAWMTSTFGGAFGEGLEDAIVDTYLRLAFNYEDGDEIYIFGFSRGAFAARRLAGLINTAGIVSRRYADKAWEAYRLYHNAPRHYDSDDKKREHHEAAEQFRKLYGKGGRNADGTRKTIDAPPPITYLGVFDTVIQRGWTDIVVSLLPKIRSRYTFGNLNVCPNVQSARHAVAVDETRLGFPVTLWEGLDESNARARERPGADRGRLMFQQRWFIGTHGDVGGGIGSKHAANSLKWVAEGAAEQGLRFYAQHGEDLSPMDEALREVGLHFDAPISRPKSLWKALHPMNYPIRSRRIWRERRVQPGEEDLRVLLDTTVVQRATANHVRPRYQPAPLKPFRKVLRDMIKRAHGG